MKKCFFPHPHSATSPIFVRHIFPPQDEHILDLYLYYAQLGMGHNSPRVRVFGLSILSQIVLAREELDYAQQGDLSLEGENLQSLPLNGIFDLTDSFVALSRDSWWEVKAQLLWLTSHLLPFAAASSPRHVGGQGAEGGGSAGEGQSEGGGGSELVVGKLLKVLKGLFVPNNSKNALQVGLCAVTHLLGRCPELKSELMVPFVQVSLFWSGHDTSTLPCTQGRVEVVHGGGGV